MYYFPKEKVGIVVLYNGTTCLQNNIVVAGLCAYFYKPFTVLSIKPISPKTEDLGQFLREFSSKDMPLKITMSNDFNAAKKGRNLKPGGREFFFTR